MENCRRLLGIRLLLQQHVVVRGETDASLQDVLDASTLAEESIDELCVFGDEGSFEEVGEDGQNWVELVEFGGGGGLVGDAAHELGEDDEVVDDGGGEKRVFACVVEDDGIVASHEDLGCVFVHGSLGITNVWDILDDNDVVGVLAFLVEDGVGGNHVVYDIALGDFLGSELLRSGQVLAVVVSEMVVADDGCELETSGDEEVSEDGFDLGLSSLEVITTNVYVVLHGEVDDTRDEGILRGSVDVGDAFQDTGNSEDGGGSDL